MAQFRSSTRTACFFLLPQLLVVLVFFMLPAGVAILQSLFYSDAFGIGEKWAGIGNFTDLLADPGYIQAVGVTLILAIVIAAATLCLGLLAAVAVRAQYKGKRVLNALLIWPYAVAPAVAAILWRFLWQPNMAVIIIAAVWQQFSYNFLFYYAALSALPASMQEAAIIDGASPWQRFWTMTVPLLAPTSFYLWIMNLIYGFFDTFGIIDVMTSGGPGTATTSLVYKVYQDGFIGLDPGNSSAQSVVLMIMVMGITWLQFRYIDKRVHY